MTYFTMIHTNGLEQWQAYYRGSLVGTFMSRAAAVTKILELNNKYKTLNI